MPPAEDGQPSDPPSGRRRIPRPPPRVRRFLTVGASGVLVNNAVLGALHGLAGLALLPATVVAVGAATTHNYVLHELWTFRSMRLSPRRFVHFAAVTLGALVLNVGIVQLLVWFGLFYLVANLVGIAAGFTV